MNGTLLPVIFRIERQATDQDGDGVPDWRDNCPTVYNPPSAPKHDVLPSAPTPPKCDYRHDDCDPQEVDCRKAEHQEAGGLGPRRDRRRLRVWQRRRHLRADRRLPPGGQLQSRQRQLHRRPRARRHLLLGRQRLQRRRDLHAPAPAWRSPPPTCPASTDPCQVSLCDMVDGCATTPAADGVACAVANGSGACNAGRCTVTTCNRRLRQLRQRRHQRLRARRQRRRVQLRRLRSRLQPHLRAPRVRRGLGVGQRRLARSRRPRQRRHRRDGPLRLALPARDDHLRRRPRLHDPRHPDGPGQPYCMTAWIRASSDAIPFLGITSPTPTATRSAWSTG